MIYDYFVCLTGIFLQHELNLFFTQKQRPNDPALWFCNERNEDRIWSFEELRNESVKAALLLQILLKDELKSNQHSLPFVLTILSRTPEWWFLHMVLSQKSDRMPCLNFTFAP